MSTVVLPGLSVDISVEPMDAHAWWEFGLLTIAKLNSKEQLALLTGLADGLEALPGNGGLMQLLYIMKHVEPLEEHKQFAWMIHELHELIGEPL